MNHSSLGSILTQAPVTLKADAMISEAIETLKKFQISSVAVVDESFKAIGIFTEHDALRIIAEEIDQSTSITTVMSYDPISLEENINFNDAYTIMSENHYRHLIITDSLGKCIGVVTEGDMIRHIGLQYLGKLKKVSEAMNDSPLIFEWGTTLKFAAAEMKNKKTDYGVLLKGGSVYGIVTERNIIHAFGSGSNTSEPIENLVQTDFMEITEETPLEDAAVLMEQHGVHQLVVLSETGQFCGLLTRRNVLKIIHHSYVEYLLEIIEKKNDTIMDLGERSKNLEYKTALLQTLVFTIPCLLWLRDKSGKFLTCNPAFADFHNSEHHSIVGKYVHEFDSFQNEKDLSYLDNEVFHTRELHVCEISLPVQDDHKVFQMYKSPMFNHDGELIGILGIAHDISDRKQYESQLQLLANFDPLTGLSNRVSLLNFLELAISKAKRENTLIALIQFDLDMFKNVNDSFGHTIGDQLLIQIAKRLSNRVREIGMIARIGGDEFALILEEIQHHNDAAKLAGELIDLLDDDYPLENGSSIHVSVSAGISIYPDHTENALTMLQHADTALYRAKAEGRKRYCYYSDELTRLAKQRIENEIRLRHAIEAQEFEVYYQPKVHLKTGRIIGAEALIRWNDPERGRISPLHFIPLAEETGLICAIGEWVLRETCRQGKIWLNQGHRLLLSVNISAYQIRRQDVLHMLQEVLESTQYPADKLEFELTESALMDHEQETVDLMHRLRALGVHLSIDDFGTGYSSLSYLKRFPIDVLKIDKSFVEDIPFDTNNMAIAEAIIAMGKALGFQILAEGVENEEQIAFLQEKGCHQYQGYFKSAPLPADEFIKLLENM